MTELLVNIDRWWFYAINNGWANPVFDFIFPLLTEGRNWMPVYAGLFVFLFWRGFRKPGGKIYLLCAAALILCVLISDQLSSSVIKELAGRIRPCRALEDVRLLVPCGAGKSFPSSHAVNNFGAAVVLSFFFRKQWKWFFIIAASVAFSRIYVGVHYPFDVLSGAVIGALCGLFVVFIANKLIKRYHL